MKRRLVILTALVALTVPIAARSGTTYGVAIRGATVNVDHSVTISWMLENEGVSNSSIAVDATIVRSGSDRFTTFRTRPLAGGWHTITIEAREVYEAYTPEGSVCVPSGQHLVCARIWRRAIRVNVPYATNKHCVVPRVVGLKLNIAKAKIKGASCSLGAVKRVHSKRPAGTVLLQRPKTTKRKLPEGAAIRLVVSNGHRQASIHT
jgi:hypothetical protein